MPEDGMKKGGDLLTLFFRCPLPYVVIDKNGVFDLVNPAASEAIGYASDDLEGRRFSDLIHPEDKAYSEEIIRRVRGGGGGAMIEHRILTKQGEYKPVAWHCVADIESGTLYAIGAEVGMGDSPGALERRKLAELAYLLRQAQEIAGVGDFVLDIVTPELSTWSEQALRILGASSTMPNLTYVDILKDIIHRQDRRGVYEALVSSIEHVLAFEQDFRIVLPNQVIRHVHVQAEPVCNEKEEVVRFIGTLLDITERKRTEEELRASHDQTAAILDTTVDGIITINEVGCIHSFNKAAERIFGYRAEEVIGENVHILMPVPYNKEHDTYLKNYINTGTAKIIGIGREVIGKRKDGSTFPMELAVSETKGRRRIFTGIVRDITTRREMQREILQVGEYERQRIGQELHDGLGSQLTGIGMICQSLARQLEKTGSPYTEDLKEIAEQIKEADYHARNLARGLVPVVADPDGLVTALKRLTGFGENSGIACEVHVLGEIRIEDSTVSTHLYRIAQEAVVNAVKHSRASSVQINISRDDQSGDITLEILDDGIGLPEALEDASGIGLRTMRYRAGMLGAQFYVNSEKNKGTLISCTISGRDLEAYKAVK